jgi:hypothetical protein
MDSRESRNDGIVNIDSRSDHPKNIALLSKSVDSKGKEDNNIQKYRQKSE